MAVQRTPVVHATAIDGATKAAMRFVAEHGSAVIRAMLRVRPGPDRIARDHRDVLVDERLAVGLADRMPVCPVDPSASPAAPIRMHKAASCRHSPRVELRPPAELRVELMRSL